MKKEPQSLSILTIILFLNAKINLSRHFSAEDINRDAHTRTMVRTIEKLLISDMKCICWYSSKLGKSKRNWKSNQKETILNVIIHW